MSDRHESLIRRYRAERLPTTMVGVVSLILAAAAQAGMRQRAIPFLTDTLLAGLLFVQCRILDDLADRTRDARRHPHRVLVAAASTTPVAVAGLLIAAATLLLLMSRPASLGSLRVESVAHAAVIGYLLLAAMLACYYTLRRGRSLVGDHLFLTKYPAFVWIIAASSLATRPELATSRLLLAMVATYLGACLYEALHDADSPAAARPILTVVEGLLLTVVLLLLVVPGSLERYT